MIPVTLTGTNAHAIALLGSVLTAKGYSPWIVWDATLEMPPQDLINASRGQLLTFQACVYAEECQILTTRKILDRTNEDYVWIVDADQLTVKDLPETFASDKLEDVILCPEGYSRFSRKALECISRDFGVGLDYSNLTVSTEK